MGLGVQHQARLWYVLFQKEVRWVAGEVFQQRSEVLGAPTGQWEDRLEGGGGSRSRQKSWEGRRRCSGAGNPRERGGDCCPGTWGPREGEETLWGTCTFRCV